MIDQVGTAHKPFPEASSGSAAERRSRRAILVGALGAVAGAGLGILGRAEPTSAARGDALVAGLVNSAGDSGTTLFSDTSSPTLATFNFGSGDGLSAVITDADADAMSAFSRATFAGNGAAVRAEGGQNSAIVASSAALRRAAVAATTTAAEGIAVQGIATGTAGASRGLQGDAASTSGVGVLGRSTASRSQSEGAVGVRGESAAFVGVLGVSSGRSGHGVVGRATSIGETDPSGVYGDTGAREGAGLEGWSRAATGVGYGVYGTSAGSAAVGVRGTSTAESGSTYGVYGDVSSPGGLALFGLGNARVTGDLVVHGRASSGGATYRIDHPSNQASDRALSHALVGSDQWRNVYDGSAICDGAGEALVQLPAWFGRLNRDARIQLTPVGAYSPVYVSQGVQNNRFRISGGAPGLEVAWLVTAVRRDRWAQEHPLRVEETKRGKEAGRLLHPEERGAAASRGVAEAFRLERRRRRFR